MNGRITGYTPIELEISPGIYDIRIEKAGYASYQRKVKVQKT